MKTTLGKPCFLLFAVAIFLGSCLSPKSDEEEKEIEQSIESKDQYCSELTPGEPIGLSCVHCAHPNAQKQAAELAEIMLSSCKENLAVNFLINGHFGYDDEAVTRQINRLAATRKLTVILYLSNGHSQRHGYGFDTGAFDAAVSPEEFRTRIVYDPLFQEAYQNVVERAVLIRGAVPASVQFILVPGLEDNMTDEVFNFVLELTKQVAGDEVSYGRSSCPNCYSGNESGVPAGVLEEVHTDHVYHGVSGGVVFSDGRPYVFAYEMPSDSELSLADLSQLKENSEDQSNIFILWTAKYQGLVVERSEITQTPHPNLRSYVSPSTLEQQELIQFLR